MTPLPVSDAAADLVVVGTGVAGLTAALRATELGLRVVVVTKAAVEDGNTRWAQGGVAVVLPDAGDSVEAHVGDTLCAGAGLCDEIATHRILAAGSAAVAALRCRGAVFDSAGSGVLERTREGGHRAFRVIHAGGDATGAEVERALSRAARDGRLPLLERQSVTDVLLDETGRVAGVALLGTSGRAGRSMVRAPAVLLATGGLGQLYAVTSNPEVSTGDGLALALRAGALATDLEFVQFHPTVLHTVAGSRGRRPLVTEAVRGEGAVLLDITGRPVMAGVHPLGDLAPRDVVAAAITRRMAATGADHVLLDATHLGSAWFRLRFPTVHAACTAAGVDPGREPIPVAPAAHYHCGGVHTDVDGRTTVSGLYAAGEVARTGLHGANRLGSNSLLEGLVMGSSAADAVCADLADRPAPGPAVWRAGERRPVADRDALQRAMSAHAGLGRDGAGLGAASAIASATSERASRTGADVENAALTLAAAAVLAAATARTESRGCHLRTDYPDSRPQWRRSIRVALDDTGAPVALEPALVGGVA